MTGAPVSGGWRPLLDGEERRAALDVVRSMARALARPLDGAGRAFQNEGEISLGWGHAGLALFFAYVDAAVGWPEAAPAARRLLAETLEGLGQVESSPSLYTGYTGVAWLLAHLLRLHPGNGESGDEIFAEVDPSLSDLLADPPPVLAPHDLVLGLLGIGPYALERSGPGPAQEMLADLVRLLAATAKSTPEGTFWRTAGAQTPAEDQTAYPEGYTMLGVSHGVAGVIGLLAAACVVGVEEGEARRLLAGAVRWLLARRLPDQETSSFPTVVGPGLRLRPAPVAWCHGDPGIAAVLLGAARATGEPEWEDVALGLAARAARFRPPLSECLDPCLCHGTAGRGHLFNRIFQATGDPRFGEASRFWFERTLVLCHEKEGETAWQAAPGFLMGTAGIGLSLLAAATSVAPDWDRVLLLSPPATTR